jgi:hypothetical protein
MMVCFSARDIKYFDRQALTTKSNKLHYNDLIDVHPCCLTGSRAYRLKQWAGRYPKSKAGNPEAL